MRLVVTGGCGFIGANFVRHALAAGAAVVNLDALTYAGNPENLAGVKDDPRYTFIQGDIADPAAAAAALRDGADAVVNFAAESHVDRSIMDAAPFVRTNVQGALTLLDAARDRGVARFIQVSTDEVYGTLGPEDPPFTEDHPLRPNSPYAASKAAADLMGRAFFQTYGLPVIITRCSNNYGPYQFPEKLIPLMITNALEGRPLPVYGDGRQVRDWVHVADHCRALWAVLERGRPGAVYNIGGHSERGNIDIVRLILRHLGRDETLITHVADRPGHDRRYAIDTGRITAELGWRPSVAFEEGLAATVAWYLAEAGWWRRIKAGVYREFYEQQYGPGRREE